MVAMLASGCDFEPAPSPIDGAIDDDARSLDAPIDGGLPACATSSDYQPGSGLPHTYRLIDEPVDYDTAIDRCTADGAHLAVIDDAAENAHVLTFVPALDEIWIGFDDLTNASFGWVTGAPVGYTNWDPGEPNDSGVEDCAVMIDDGTWNDSACSNGRSALCECDPAYTPPPTPACRTAGNPTVIFGRRYFLNTTEQTWNEAFTTCASMGAHLVVFADSDEDTTIDNMYPADSWIGFSDQAVEGTFAWTNQAPNDYVDWDPAAPSTAADNTEDCVYVNVDWDDTDCDVARPFTCECDPSPP
jgi:hypothetical protein